MPTVQTEREKFAALAASAPTGVRIPVEAVVQVDSPWTAYRRARDAGHGFYFETGGGTDGWGYFCVSPSTIQQTETDSLSFLRSLQEEEELVRGPCEVPYPGGWFGWLSYDIARELETIPETTTADRSLPRLELAKCDTVAAWQTPLEDGPVSLRLIASPRVEHPDSAYDEARDRITELAERIKTGEMSVETPSIEAAPFRSECNRAAYTDRVKTVKQRIRDGDTFQANISQRLRAPAAVHPVTAYEALREVNPAPYAGLLEFPAVDLVSASPELLLEREGSHLETEPIAGTRPRGSTSQKDADLEAELNGDIKEAAEHAMLVDLERNDLGKVSVYGSVEVPEYRRVDRYSEVMHLVSRVTGRLRSEADLADTIGAVFPGGTITGAPKPETMAIIDQVEATRRGPYTGSMAAIGFDGRATLNIIIRTLVRHDEMYTLRVGGGIVHDSDPDREYAETIDKARALVTALSSAADAELGGVAK